MCLSERDLTHRAQRFSLTLQVSTFVGSQELQLFLNGEQNVLDGCIPLWSRRRPDHQPVCKA